MTTLEYTLISIIVALLIFGGVALFMLRSRNGDLNASREAWKKHYEDERKDKIGVTIKLKELREVLMGAGKGEKVGLIK